MQVAKKDVVDASDGSDGSGSSGLDAHTEQDVADGLAFGLLCPFGARPARSSTILCGYPRWVQFLPCRAGAEVTTEMAAMNAASVKRSASSTRVAMRPRLGVKRDR